MTNTLRHSYEGRRDLPPVLMLKANGVITDQCGCKPHINNRLTIKGYGRLTTDQNGGATQCGHPSYRSVNERLLLTWD